MEATDILMSEHRVIERVLAALDAEAAALEAGTHVRPQFFLDAADFVAGFADGCHHRKEEGALFTTLFEYGMPVRTGPVAAMLADHRQGRVYIAAMREGANRLAAGDAPAAAEVIANARGYTSLLREHIMKEDHILFPMAGNMIPEKDQGRVLEAFEHVEQAETGEGVHEKYLALANALESEAAQAAAAPGR